MVVHCVTYLGHYVIAQKPLVQSLIETGVPLYTMYINMSYLILMFENGSCGIKHKTTMCVNLTNYQLKNTYWTKNLY